MYKDSFRAITFIPAGQKDSPTFYVHCSNQHSSQQLQ